jgi:hypothetical protein
MSEVLRPQMVILAYWLVMALLAAFFLRMACSLCRTEMPTWRRSIISTLLVTFLAYLAFDFTSYLIMRSMEDMGIQVPSWYGYNFWFREPLALKWYIVSHAGAFRFVPFIVAIVVASFLQFIVLQAQVTFGWSLLIVVLQWAAIVVAGYIVSLLFGVLLNAIGWTLQPTSVAKAPTLSAKQAQTTPARTRQKEKAAAGKKTSKTEKPIEAATDTKVQRRDQNQQVHEEPKTLEILTHEVEGAARAPREYLENAGENLKSYADSHLAELEEELEPVTRHLPEPAQNFLAKGGWWVVIGSTGLIALLWLRSILRRLGGGFRKPKTRPHRRKGAPSIPKERLALITAGFTDRGPQQLMVKGLPARLRLVILSPATRDASDIGEEMADRILDWIKPGLAEVASYDQPGVRVWPPFYSADGFAVALGANVPTPKSKGMRSHWVLVTGQISMGRVVIHVGLVLHADETNSLRLIHVKRERWPGVLSVEKTPEEAIMR